MESICANQGCGGGRLKWLAMILLLVVCAGCSVTMTGSAKWSEVDGSAQELETIQKEHGQLLAAVSAMTKELETSERGIDPVLSVLKKYGINVGTQAVPQTAGE